MNINTTPEDGGLELQYMYPRPQFYAPQDYYNNNNAHQSATPLPFGHLPQQHYPQHPHYPQQQQQHPQQQQHAHLASFEQDIDDSHLQKRCQNCGGFFYEKDNTSPSVCAYHPGGYRSPDSITPDLIPASGMFLRWSCCGGREQSTPGCKRAYHVVDEVTSSIIRRFEALAQESPSNNNTSTSTSSDGPLLTFSDLTPSAPPKPQQQQQQQQQHTTPHTVCETGDDGAKMFVHKVQMTDTLPGLALRYGVRAMDIRLANRLASDSVISRKELVIPNPTRIPEDVTYTGKRGASSNLINLFLQETDCRDKLEAKFYLEDYDNDLQKAVGAYKADLAWEATNGPAKKVTSNVSRRT